MPYHPRSSSATISSREQPIARGSMIQVLPGVIAPREFTYVAEFHEPGAPTVTLTVRASGDRFKCHGMELRGDSEITAATLRMIPLADLLRDASTLALVSGSIDEDGTPRLSTADEVPEEQQRVIEKRAPKPRGYKLTDIDLQQVAQTYREALAAGLPATEHVKRAHGPISRTTASRWIRRARDAGYLGEAIGTRAGERVSG